MNIDLTISSHVEPISIRVVRKLCLKCNTTFSKLKVDEIIYVWECISLQNGHSGIKEGIYPKYNTQSYAS